MAFLCLIYLGNLGEGPSTGVWRGEESEFCHVGTHTYEHTREHTHVRSLLLLQPMIIIQTGVARRGASPKRSLDIARDNSHFFYASAVWI